MIAKTKRKTKLTPAAEYVRMSTDDQKDSPGRQRDVIARLAKREACEVVRRFADEGVTGDSGPEDRPDFNAMLAAAERGEFAVLLLENGDRLGRFDSIKGGIYYDRLREAGVRIVTDADGEIDLDSFEGRVVHTVKQEGRHAFLIDLSRRVTDAMFKAAGEGRRCGARNNYGYDRAQFDGDKLVRRLRPGQRKDTKGHRVGLVPSEDEAKVEAVEFMFETYAQKDVTMWDLCRRLEQRGYPSPSGKGWNGCGLKVILQNPVYLGVTRWGASQVGKYHTIEDGQPVRVQRRGKAGRVRPKDDGDHVVVERTHEPLVDQGTFERVQAKLATLGKRYRRRRAAYPLSGLIYCEHCGDPMWGVTVYSRDSSGRNKYRYVQYVCRNYRGRPGRTDCGHYKVDADLVHGWVIRVLQAAFLAGGNREKLVGAVARKLGDRGKAPEAERARVQKRVDELDREIKRLVKAIRRVDDDGLADELADAKDERAQLVLENKLAAGLRTPQDVRGEAERIVDQLWGLAESLSDADPATLREVLHRVVARITCRWQTRKTKGGRARYDLVGGVLELRQIQAFSCLLGQADNDLPFLVVSSSLEVIKAKKSPSCPSTNSQSGVSGIGRALGVWETRRF